MMYDQLEEKYTWLRLIQFENKAKCSVLRVNGKVMCW